MSGNFAIKFPFWFFEPFPNTKVLFPVALVFNFGGIGIPFY